jgi:hypothetical protein
MPINEVVQLQEKARCRTKTRIIIDDSPNEEKLEIAGLTPLAQAGIRTPDIYFPGLH